MTVELIVIGKTDSKEIAALVEMYARRVNFYCKFAVTALPDVRNTRNLTVKQQRTAEGEAILRQTTDGDYVVLLDERGEEMRSVEFAYWLQKRMNSGVKRLVLVIGGPYGFSDEVYRRADAKLSLSRMTFSHQIVRAIFAEQIYRAFTILNNDGPTGLVDSASLSTFLAAGAYTLTVTGNSFGNGQFGGNTTVTATSAAPEPASWGLMILGFLGGEPGAAGRDR